MKTAVLNLNIEIKYETKDEKELSAVSSKIKEIIEGYFNNGDLILKNEMPGFETKQLGVSNINASVVQLAGLSPD